MERSRPVRRLSVIVAALAMLACIPAATAADVTVTVIVKPGTLSLGLNGSETVRLAVAGGTRTSFVIPLRIADETGSGSGWRLTVKAKPFVSAGRAARTLPAGSLTVPQLTVTCAVAATCAPPLNSVRYPVAIPVGDALPAANLVDAAPASGLGLFDVGVTVQIVVPASARAGVYSGELTLALVSGP
jgi:hypothetical protein